MPLTPGTRLGPYEIAAQIGVGGMGGVYKATDTNLKRAVAIKVLAEWRLPSLVHLTSSIRAGALVTARA